MQPQSPVVGPGPGVAGALDLPGAKQTVSTSVPAVFVPPMHKLSMTHVSEKWPPNGIRQVRWDPSGPIRVSLLHIHVLRPLFQINDWDFYFAFP